MSQNPHELTKTMHRVQNLKKCFPSKKPKHTLLKEMQQTYRHENAERKVKKEKGVGTLLEKGSEKEGDKYNFCKSLRESKEPREYETMQKSIKETASVDLIASENQLKP